MSRVLAPFGQLRLERTSIPDVLRDVDAWPSVDVSALSPDRRASFELRCKAIRLYLTSPSTTVAEIVLCTRLTRKGLYHLLERCFTLHPDGRIFGFRGAVPHLRIKDYVRTAPVSGPPRGHGGASGAFSQLLSCYPLIDQKLRRAFAERNKKIEAAREVRKSMRSIHRDFLKTCRDVGIGPTAYPFTEQRLGIRSLYAFFTKLARESFEMTVVHTGGRRANALPSHFPSAPAATRAFEVVEFDGHKIDLRLTVKIRGPSGIEQLVEIPRIWILVLLDIATRCVIGYHIALSREYSKQDVASALQAALMPIKPRRYTIPTLAIREGGGFPANVVPGTAGACWDWFRCDNAKAHLAFDTIDKLTRTIGCWTDIGPPAQPNDRPHIERFFHLVSRHFAHTLPGNLGSNPDAIERALSDPGKDTRLLVQLDELEEMIEVLIADYNGEPHPALDGRTPLEAMAYSMGKYGNHVRVLPTAARANLSLLQEAKVVTVKGVAERGVRPHINFSNVRYTSPLLASNPALVGKQLRIYFDVRDIRTVKAYFQDGTELGVLTAARPWGFTPHSLKVRQEIFRLIAEKKLVLREGDSPTEAWVRHKLSQRDPKRSAAQVAKQQRLEKKSREKASEGEADEGEPFVSLRAHGSLQEQSASIAAQSVEDSPPSQEEQGVQPRPLTVRRTFTF
jgi:putative transposase